jgi:hypothetical protein
MKLTIGAAAVAALATLALAGGAQSAVFVNSIPGAPDPGPLAGETQVITFDGGVVPAGVTLTGDYGLQTGSLAGHYAAPAGDTTTYFETPNATTDNAAEIDFAPFLGNRDVARFSFYWGSIDSYNTLQLLDRSGHSFFTISGASIPPAAGDWTDPSMNRRVTFTLSGDSRNLGGLLFTSTSPAFEIDTISFGAVPEPASWAFMMLGFGGLGAVLRRRRAAAFA